ncbi:PH domain-containing protein [Nitrosovibrio sp. Nv17]|uniref:PH domain-containing protein n=1 Tax=Nitrosovibrio sp. Nv17 TaxID=1855339 RepID=UPI000908717B|nr:PH domain-containing protein [Nitrosovibrio sp. Nv17]SFW12961.1 PH domain-containing protein [Nitrosovibrio sp. Nv17]
MADAIIYRSRIDAWIAIALGLGAALPLVVVFPAALDASGPAALIAFSTAVLPAVLLGWLIRGLGYTLTRKELRVRCGPFFWIVPLETIHAVVPTRSPLSSPALSLDRLRIDYGHGNALMISPRDKEDFLRELGARRGAIARYEAAAYDPGRQGPPVRRYETHKRRDSWDGTRA